MVGKPEHLKETHASAGRTCKLHIERPCPSWELNPGPSCYEVTVLTTKPSCIPNTVYLKPLYVPRSQHLSFYSAVVTGYANYIHRNDEQKHEISPKSLSKHCCTPACSQGQSSLVFACSLSPTSSSQSLESFLYIFTSSLWTSYSWDVFFFNHPVFVVFAAQ